jgi:hypothetical protein
MAKASGVLAIHGSCIASNDMLAPFPYPDNLYLCADHVLVQLKRLFGSLGSDFGAKKIDSKNSNRCMGIQPLDEERRPSRGEEPISMHAVMLLTHPPRAYRKTRNEHLVDIRALKPFLETRASKRSRSDTP